LCWVGLIALGIVIVILGAIGDAIGKLFSPYPSPASRPPLSSPRLLLGHLEVIRAHGNASIEPGHDSRTCLLCLGGGHPTTVRENQQEREREVEAPRQETQYQHIPGLAWGDPSSYVRASTPEELERAREDFAKREAQRREAEAARQREAMLEEELKKGDEEKREQEAREFLIREAAVVLREREEREAAQKRKREAEANRTPWIH
jgi:hypothetical protein